MPCSSLSLFTLFVERHCPKTEGRVDKRRKKDGLKNLRRNQRPCFQLGYHCKETWIEKKKRCRKGEATSLHSLTNTINVKGTGKKNLPQYMHKQQNTSPTLLPCFYEENKYNLKSLHYCKKRVHSPKQLFVQSYVYSEAEKIEGNIH